MSLLLPLYGTTYWAERDLDSERPGLELLPKLKKKKKKKKIKMGREKCFI